MAIVKSGTIISAHHQTQGSSSTDNKLQVRESHLDDNTDSGAESDNSDDSDIAEAWTELCQVGDQTCAIPYQLFDLPDLKQILSVDTWNNLLTEEERYSLSAYLPDMNPEAFRHTLKELLAGENFHFGSPLAEVFDRLKGGLCEPKVTRYRDCLKYMQRKEHYHLLRKYHNCMVNNFLEMQKAWENCPEVSVERKLQVWNSWKICKALPGVKSQTSHILSEQKLGTPGNGKPGKPPNKKLRLAKDEVPTEVVHCPPQDKFVTARVDGKGVLKIKIPAKVPPEAGSRKQESNPEGSSRKLEPKEIHKVEKLVPKGVLKIVPKGLFKRHEQPELKQVQPEIAPLARFPETQTFETKVRPFSFLPPIGRWEDDNFAGVTSFAKPKASSKKNNSLETLIDNSLWQQGIELSNSKAGLGKAASGSARKQNKGKEQEMFYEIGMQAPVKYGGNIGQFDTEDNILRGNKFVKDPKRSVEVLNTFADEIRRCSEERPMEGVKMMCQEDMRRYAPERNMSGEDHLPVEGHWEYLDKQNRTVLKHHRIPVERYRLPVEQCHVLEENQRIVFRQQPLPFKQQMIPGNKEIVPVQMIHDNKELVPKEPKRFGGDIRKHLPNKSGTT